MVHRIDGKLFAVGVLDLTPNGLSSVYLFYDPEYAFLNPGTLCALREIEYIKKVKKEHKDDFKLYYLGLYFQDCQKSVYKANFKPSMVSCPITHRYVYLDQNVKALIEGDCKKPNLFEVIQETPIKSNYKRLTKEQAEKLIDSGFSMVYNNQMKLKLEHISEKFREKLMSGLVGVYQELGLDLIMKSQFILNTN